MTIEVFKTDVEDETLAGEIIRFLHGHFPKGRVNFDLQDCDKVMRIVGSGFSPEDIMKLVRSKGVACNILD